MSGRRWEVEWRREAGKDRVWEEEKPGLALNIVSLYIRIESGREVWMAGVWGCFVCVCVCVCVCSFLHAISMIHSLEMDRYLTCVIGIKIRPAFLVCSGACTFVSFSITKVRPHSSHKSKKNLHPSGCSYDRIPSRQEIYRHWDLWTLSSFFPGKKLCYVVIFWNVCSFQIPKSPVESEPLLTLTFKHYFLTVAQRLGGNDWFIRVQILGRSWFSLFPTALQADNHSLVLVQCEQAQQVSW